MGCLQVAHAPLITWRGAAPQRRSVTAWGLGGTGYLLLFFLGLLATFVLGSSFVGDIVGFLVVLGWPSEMDGAMSGEVGESPPGASADLWHLVAGESPAVINTGQPAIRLNEDRPSCLLNLRPPKAAGRPRGLILDMVAKEGVPA